MIIKIIVALSTEKIRQIHFLGPVYILVELILHEYFTVL